MLHASGINDINIRRPEKNRNIQNDVRIKACIQGYDSEGYSKLQFIIIIIIIIIDMIDVA